MNNFDISFSDKLEILMYSLLSFDEKLSIIEYFSNKFEISSISIGGSDFYKLLEEKLTNEYTLEDEEGINSIFNKIGIQDLPEEIEVYLIWKMPDQLVKIKLKELLLNWDEIWCPPADDALIIYIPYSKTVLFTHWGIIKCD